MSSDPPPRDATRLLLSLSTATDGGDDRARGEGELLQVVGKELRSLAKSYLKRERAGHILQPTALVHEAYLKLIDHSVISGDDRERFLALAARAMRQVLVDFARRRKAGRRGGDSWERVTLHSDLIENDVDHADLIDLENALERLAETNAKAAEVVELRFFGGLSDEEAARVLSVSDRMVRKYWVTARAWLSRELGRDGTA